MKIKRTKNNMFRLVGGRIGGENYLFQLDPKKMEEEFRTRLQPIEPHEYLYLELNKNEITLLRMDSYFIVLNSIIKHKRDKKEMLSVYNVPLKLSSYLTTQEFCAPKII